MKKLSISTILIGISFGLITVIGSLLFALGAIAFSGIGIVFIVADCLLGAVFVLLCYILSKLKEKEHKKELEKSIEQERQIQLLSLYKRFGIPPQKDASGRLLNFYELLGIEPVFDEHGERVPTVYEILSILPRFDEKGREIPFVVFIKNKTKKISENVPQICLKLQTVESYKIVQNNIVQAKGEQKAAPLVKKTEAKAAEEGKKEEKKDKKKGPKPQAYSGMKTIGASVKNSVNLQPGIITGLLKDMFSNNEDIATFVVKPKVVDNKLENVKQNEKQTQEPVVVLKEKPQAVVGQEAQPKVVVPQEPAQKPQLPKIDEKSNGSDEQAENHNKSNSWDGGAEYELVVVDIVGEAAFDKTLDSSPNAAADDVSEAAINTLSETAKEPKVADEEEESPSLGLF